VLAISILQAQGDALHPFASNWFSASGPDHPPSENYTTNAAQKTTVWVELMHHKANWRMIKFMRKIVHTLIPEITFADTPVATQNLDARVDALLDARASIQNEFGFKQFNRLGVDLQDRLILVERYWQGCNDGDDALGFVVDIYAATQARLHQGAGWTTSARHQRW
jgi:hypothetical protein